MFPRNTYGGCVLNMRYNEDLQVDHTLYLECGSPFKQKVNASERRFICNIFAEEGGEEKNIEIHEIEIEDPAVIKKFRADWGKFSFQFKPQTKCTLWWHYWGDMMRKRYTLYCGKRPFTMEDVFKE